jgi:TPR repeat protein
MSIKSLLATFVVSLSLAVPVLAGPWGNGLDAWKRGEHLTFVQQDQMKAAADWMKRAAEQGNAQAQDAIGRMYFGGVGVPKDYVEAHKWLSLAAAQGYKDTAQFRDLIASAMTPAQIAEAQRLAREWKPKE